MCFEHVKGVFREIPLKYTALKTLIYTHNTLIPRLSHWEKSQTETLNNSFFWKILKKKCLRSKKNVIVPKSYL